MLDSACIEKLNGTTSNFYFTSTDERNDCVMSGMSQPEEGGTWTDGHHVTLQCPMPFHGTKKFGKIEITAFAFLDRIPFQRVALKVNQQASVEYKFDADRRSQKMTANIPEDTGKTISIQLELPDAISPKELGVSGDYRRLGVVISNLAFK